MNVCVWRCSIVGICVCTCSITVRCCLASGPPKSGPMLNYEMPMCSMPRSRDRAPRRSAAGRAVPAPPPAAPAAPARRRAGAHGWAAGAAQGKRVTFV